MKTVAITGASGFIGRRLVAAHLARGDRVRVLTRHARPPESMLVGDVETCIGDLGEGELPESFVSDCDVLYHCAAELRNASQMYRVNFEGTRRLLEAASGRVGRWVQLSSVGVYGAQDLGDVDEGTPLRPRNLYERSKARADEWLVTRAAQLQIEYAVLRPSIVFGAGMPNCSLFQLASTIRRGLFFFTGPTGASANYIHVDNVVQALLLCGGHPAAAGRIFNQSDWRPMESFIAAIADLMQVSRPRLRLPLSPVRGFASIAELIPGNPLTRARIDALTGRVRYPADRIERELGYRHAVTMEEGLALTLIPFRQKVDHNL